jgi:hypothetical protein
MQIACFAIRLQFPDVTRCSHSLSGSSASKEVWCVLLHCKFRFWVVLILAMKKAYPLSGSATFLPFVLQHCQLSRHFARPSSSSRRSSRSQPCRVACSKRCD